MNIPSGTAGDAAFRPRFFPAGRRRQTIAEQGLGEPDYTGDACTKTPNKFKESKRVMEQLKGLSSQATDAYHAFKRTGDPFQLDAIIEGVLDFYRPGPDERPPISTLPPETELMADLGLDSLAMTEMVFMTEELFDLQVEIEELMPIRTIADLKQFMRQRLCSPPNPPADDEP